jgi:tetrapyrrole methylase family protein/MazG family protein
MEDTKLNHTDSFLDELFRLVETLRGKHGCPWDIKQTPRSVSVYLIEEVFELADAIIAENPEEIREELGDVLFHVVLVARMFQERGEFDLQDVAQAVTEKMIRRHPHVFGGQKVNSSEEVIQNWHKIKLNEKNSVQKQSLLDSVPAKLPALIRAYRITDRAAKNGVEWTEIAGGSQNLEQTLGGLKSTLEQLLQEPSSQKFGDFLFALVNIARSSKIHPDTALADSVKKFELRFKKMEELVSESNRDLKDVSLKEKALIWEKIEKIFP